MSKRFSVISRLAIRNLRRQVRRTILTSLAMIVGGTLLMISFLLLVIGITRIRTRKD